MPSAKRPRLSRGIFEALRRDGSLTGAREFRGAVRPEWVWAAQLLKRLDRERAKSGSPFTKRFASAIAGMRAAAGRTSADGTSASFDALVSSVGSRESRAVATRIAEAAAVLTDEAEAAGSVELASILAESALRMCERASTSAQSKLLTKVARGYRAAGSLDKAELLYARVRTLGRRARNYDALTRGTLGIAVVARERGNYDEAIRHFEHALHYAMKSKSRELQIMAHQGMHVVGEHTGDLALHLKHAWLAYTLSIGNAERELETLHNIAWAACVAGLVTETLAVQRAVLARSDLSPRMRFHYLGAAAMSAAQCGRREVVESVWAQLEQLGAQTPYVYEYAISLVDVADAYRELGEPSIARSLRDQATALARRFGLTGVLHCGSYLRAGLHKTPGVDLQFGVDLDEIRRTFATIAAGVLGSESGARRERART